VNDTKLPTLEFTALWVMLGIPFYTDSTP